MDVETLKTELLETLAKMDTKQMSLADLGAYAETLRVVSSIESSTYFERLASLFSTTQDKEAKQDDGFALGYIGGTL